MGAISVLLPDDLSNRLQELAKQTGRSETSYVIEAVCEHLNDIEDLRLAEERLIEIKSGKSQLFTLEEVEESLGLAD